MLLRVLAATAALCLLAAPTETAKSTTNCEPAPIVKLKPGLPPNSTYTSSAEPPARFLYMPKGYVKVRFGEDAIAEECGIPPCDMVFLGCTRNDLIVLPDPRHPDFAKIVRHELGHFNGWPATHGD